MNRIVRILRADMQNTMQMVLKALLFAVIFFVYFKMLNAKNIRLSLIVGLGQSMLIYMLGMMDVSQNIPTYIGMGCTRKSVTAAVWLRWLILFVAMIVLNVIAFYWFSPDELTVKTVVAQACGFLFVLGLNSIASVIAIYNHAVGIAVGCLVSMTIGIAIVLMGVPDKDGFGVASIVSRVGDGVFGIAVITSLVVMVIGMVVYNIHLFRYNVR